MTDVEKNDDEPLFKSYPKEEKKEESPWQLKGTVGERDSKREMKADPLEGGFYKRDSDAAKKEKGEPTEPDKSGQTVKEGSKVEKSTSFTSGIGPIYKGPEDSGAIWTTKDSAEEKSFASFGHYEYEVSAGSAQWNWAEKKGELNVVKASGKLSMVHAEVDFIDAIKKWLGIGQKKGGAGSGSGGGGGPMAARLLDPTSHGSPLVPGTGSPNVIIGGMPAWRTVSDFHACPIVKGLVPDVGGVVMKGAMTVLINCLPAARAGDMIVEIPGGPNSIVMGCPTVMIGESGGGGGGGDDKPPVDIEAKAKGDILTLEGEANVGANFDAKTMSGDVTAKVGGSFAVAKGDIGGAIKFKIPFTDHYVVLGGTAYGSAVSVGAEAGGRVAVNKVNPETGKKQLFHAEAGAKVEAGVGAGLKFSLSIE